MEKARYGRMMLGRCLTRNYYVGCASDVLTHMDARCSGRQQCEIQIPDPVLFKAQPCPKDLVAYLEASYTCLSGRFMFFEVNRFVCFLNTIIIEYCT